MTQTGGFDFLIAWGIFAALVGVLLWFIVRGRPDVFAEAARRPGDPPPDRESGPPPAGAG